MSFEGDELSRSDVGYPDEVSLEKNGLRLETEEDCKEFCKKLNLAKKVRVVRLEGNSIGKAAANRIGKCLVKRRNEIERLVMNDIFTGRSKNEIPGALTGLLDGIKGCPNLVELNLSDNAFGPIGMERLVDFLPTCENLHVLRLHNNGLGIQGATKLASALLSLTKKPRFSLRKFFCGRNRLENEGAIAISNAFKRMSSLNEVQMPQNGIRGKGIAAIFDGLERHSNMVVLNLNDNAFLDDAAFIASRILPKFLKLQLLNIGDCIIKDDQLRLMAPAIAKLPKLDVLDLSANEISSRGAEFLFEALRSSSKFLQFIDISSNEITSVCTIQQKWQNVVAGEILFLSSEDESVESDETETSSGENRNPLIDRMLISVIQRRFEKLARFDIKSRIDCLLELSIISKTPENKKIIDEIIDAALPDIIEKHEIDEIVGAFRYALGLSVAVEYGRKERMTKWRHAFCKSVLAQNRYEKFREALYSEVPLI